MSAPVTFNIWNDLKNYVLFADALQSVLKSLFKIHRVASSGIKYNLLTTKLLHETRLTQCPTCKLAMESHSTEELMECCMKQVSEGLTKEEQKSGICPNCKHDIKKHSSIELAECTIAFLKSDIL